MKRLSRFLLLFAFNCVSLILIGQSATVFGRVSDLDSDKPLDFVDVFSEDKKSFVQSDESGVYSIEIPSDQSTILFFRRIGYAEVSYEVPAMRTGAKRYVNIKLAAREADVDIVIVASKIVDGGMVKEEVTEFKMLPTASSNFESVLPHIALGVSTTSGGELSSQYNVRGGNYDENLVYVNDFEIFRPQLIRAGQQEGLSFPNMDLIRDISFSSGGFESKYGDKMASVLDVRYKRPDEFKASISGSFLGASAHIEGSKRLGPNAYNKLRYLVGGRYKTTKYLLGSLDTKGEYVPNFFDLQTYLTYDFTKALQLSVIGNYNTSKFDFEPSSRSTALGLINFALRLTSVFEGKEKDKFINGMSGVGLTYVPENRKNPLYLKLLGGYYSSNEQENFDILGFYRLSQIETGLGSDNFGNEVAVLGVGTQHNYARNYLYNRIINLEHKGGIEIPKENGSIYKSNFIQWGVKFQKEFFIDAINEWERLDSAGYSIPYDGESVQLQEVLKTTNTINNGKLTGFVQNTYTVKKDDRYELSFNVGTRVSYTELSKETFVSPRAAINYQPLNWGRDISFKLAGGIYHQTPFYRELRRIDGSLNPNVLSQRSRQLVGGINYDFKWSKVSAKPFRLISEIYYKAFDNLISYDVDNVRIRYSGENDAEGYAAGIDLRINGEFVPGAESWLNLGLLKTRESFYEVDHKKRFKGDSTGTTVKYVPRPTDRLMTLNLFFQDYLPRNENFKVNVNFSYGTGLPFGILNDNTIYRNTYRFKSYHRVDIGFAYQIWDQKRARKGKQSIFDFTQNTWISLEVFNLLQVANAANNTWIKTITGTQYAIANNLTSRRVNLRFRMEF